tara:strand:+ start:2141 stop:3388 length:1248 start_codon:yes stop_codon:yes gene_type:complete
MLRVTTLCLLLLATSATAAEPLRLNTDIFPPYQVREGDQLSGSSIKALACIFDALDMEYQIRVLPWERAIQEVGDDKADGFFSATRMNRANNFATLSAPLALEKWYWYSNQDRPLQPAEGRAPLRVAGIRGSNEANWLRQRGYRVDPLVSSTSQLLQLLQRERIDAFLADQQTLRIELTRQPTVLRPRHARFQQYTTLGVYFANRYLQRHPGFMERFNQQVFDCLPEIGVLHADERQRLQKLYNLLFASWRHEPRLIEAVMQHNSQHNQLSLPQIHTRDQQWQQERAEGGGPLIDAVMQNPTADWLRARQQEHDGLVSEILLTGQQGLNVATSNLSTDYWQGDEAKFAEPFFASEGQPYMGQLGYDQSTRRYQVHISSGVRNPHSGEVIGVLIIGLDIEQALRMENALHDGALAN